MCGIYGMATFDGAPLRYTDKSEAMGALQRHRGPDSSRVVQTGEALLGCERLRIIDLRERADQPFACSEVGCVVACNGEIYNHSELRSEVSDYRWVSDSDVEVILPLFLRHGAQAIERLEGMFALAIWDARDRTLILARDPAGEKPLFYIEIGGEIWFASEIQSLLVHPQLERRLDEKAFAQYAMLGYVPGDRTAFAGIRKVPPGTICTFSAGGRTTCRYWRPERLPATVGSTPELIEELQRRIQSAVVRQLRADVPVGIFLSGGVDSAVITALAARDMAPGSLRTFSVGFSEPSFDEGSDAARLARRLGTKHHDVVADETALADALTVVVDQLAEPLADPAILPTYLLARRAGEEVTVVLSGEGADELFGGYPTYLGHHLMRHLDRAPAGVRSLLRGIANSLPASRRKVTFEFLLRRLVRGMDAPWPDRHFKWFGRGAEVLLAPGIEPELDFEGIDASATLESPVSRATVLDYYTYLPDDLIVKNDRATMFASIEARAPFLDASLTAFAMGLPDRHRVRGATTKWLFKRAVEPWVGREPVRRRKRGLSVPVASWIDRGLRSEVDRLLEPRRLERQGLFDPKKVRQALVEHRSKRANHARSLWTAIVFEYWLERWLPESA